jgi:hypothetical protein
MPKRLAPHVHGMIQAAIATGVATTIAAGQLGTSDMHDLRCWLGCWLLSWATMLPVIGLVAPLIQCIVASLTEDDRTGHAG